MNTTLSATLFCALLMGISYSSAAPKHDDTVAVQADGSVTWNLLPLKNDRELIKRLRRARAEKSEVHLTAVRNARYDAFARVMAIMQREDVGKIGIITPR